MKSIIAKTIARSGFIVGEVKQFWMSAVRDKAYVIFDTQESAEAARQAVHSLEWPERMRTSLRPK